MKEPQYMYFVEYYCPEQEKKLFKISKEAEFRKHGTKLDRRTFLEVDGYYDSFVYSPDYKNEKDACNFAKAKSKETGDFAHVKAGWYEYKYGEWELEELDENYFRQFNVGREI